MFNFFNRKKNNNTSEDSFGDDELRKMFADMVDQQIAEHGIEEVAARASQYTDNLIERDGFEETVSLYARVISDNTIQSHEIALQFVLEELDAARQGNDTAVNFVNNSGFKSNEYIGAMKNSFAEVDGPDGPQQMLLNQIMTVSSMDLRVELRVAIVDNIMQEWKLGKYAK
jgi:hypothetical protein